MGGRLSRSELLTPQAVPLCLPESRALGMSLQLPRSPTPLQPFILLNLAQFLGKRGTEILPSISTGCAGNYFMASWTTPPYKGGWQPGRPIKRPPEESSSFSSLPPRHTSDLVAAETMGLGVLCLALVLLGVLQSQAQDSTQNLIPVPPLINVPLQPGFWTERVGP